MLHIIAFTMAILTLLSNCAGIIWQLPSWFSTQKGVTASQVLLNAMRLCALLSVTGFINSVQLYSLDPSVFKPFGPGLYLDLIWIFIFVLMTFLTGPVLNHQNKLNQGNDGVLHTNQ